MPIAELNPYQQRFCLRARVTSKSQMRYWDKPTSKGNLFSVDLLDASGEIRGTFFKETADKVFPLLEEGKVYTFQETSGRLKPANKQVRSRRPTVLRRLHAVDARRLRESRSWVVSFWILRPFGPRRATATPRAVHVAVPRVRVNVWQRHGGTM